MDAAQIISRINGFTYVRTQKLYQSPQHTSLRPKMLLTALKNLEIHKVFLRFFALPATFFARKVAHCIRKQQERFDMTKITVEVDGMVCVIYTSSYFTMVRSV